VYTAPAGSSDSRNAHSVDLFRVVRPPLRACSTRRFPAGPAMVWLNSLIEHPGCRETLIVKRALWLLNALCCSLPSGPHREHGKPGSAALAPEMVISAKATTVGSGPVDSRNCPRIQAKKRDGSTGRRGAAVKSPVHRSWWGRSSGSPSETRTPDPEFNRVTRRVIILPLCGHPARRPKAISQRALDLILFAGH